MRMNNDSWYLVFDYLDASDLNSFACTSRISNERKIQYHFGTPIIRNSNIYKFLRSLKMTTHFKKLTIFEDIKDISAIKHLFDRISCTALHLHKSIDHFRSLNFVANFSETIRHISVFDGSFPSIDLSQFRFLNSVSIENHSDAEKVVRHLNKYKNITKFSLVNCPFIAHTELEDYVFGDLQVVETVYATYCLPYIQELIVKNTFVVYNDLTFELFEMMPEWFPNLKRLVLFDSPINPISLQVMSKFEFVEYFELQSDIVILKDVKFNKSLKYLRIHADALEIDNFVCNNVFHSLKLHCNKLIITSDKPLLFSSNLVYIEVSPVKIYKYQNEWYKHAKYWEKINKTEAYSIISHFEQ